MKASPLDRFAPWAAAAAVALPVVASRYPPMLDLPNHEEIVAAMRHFGDASRYPPGLLAWNVGHPNQLFYFVAWALALVVPVALACKIAVAGCVAGIPLGAARLSDHLGASRWGAVAAAPLGLGLVFYFGFVGNLLACGLFLAALPALDVLAREPSPARAARGVLVLLVLYAAHESALVAGCFALVALSAACARPLTIRETAYRAAPLAAAAGLVVFEQVRAVRAMVPQLKRLPPVINLALWQKVDGAPAALLGLHGRSSTRTPFLLIVATLALLALERVQHRPRGAAVAWRERLEAHRFELLGALLVGAYFEVPFSIQGAMWLDARFLLLGVAVLAVTLAPRGAPPSILTRVVAASSIAAVLAMVRPEIEATGAVHRDLDPILSEMASGSAVAHVDLVGGPFRNLVFSVGGVVARAAAERGGRVDVSFLQDSPIPPVVIADEARWTRTMERLSGDGLGLRPARDLRRFRYVLAFTSDADAERLRRALAPEGRFVARSGQWMLFESTLPVESIVSREGGEEGDVDEETLRERLGRAAR